MTLPTTAAAPSAPRPFDDLRDAGSRLLTDAECLDALRGSGVMWIAYQTETGIREVAATYDGSGPGLLARPAPTSDALPRSVAIATSGDDERRSWRVVGLALVVESRDVDPGVVRLVPTRLLGSSRTDASEAVGFGSV